MQEAPKAWAEFEEWVARHTAGTVRDEFAWVQEDGTKVGKKHREYELKTSDGKALSRLSPFVLDDERPGAADIEPNAAFPQEVTCVNEGYAFRLSREAVDDSWVVTYLSSDTQYLHDWMSSGGEPLRAGLLVDQVFMGDLLKNKSFIIESVELAQRAGRDCVEVRWRVDPSVGTIQSKVHHGMFRKGTLVLDPSRRWVLQESESWMDNPDGRELRQVSRFRYRDAGAGFPLIEREEIDTFGYDEGVHHLVGAFDLKSEKEIPDAEFTLSGFGLPEPSLRDNAKRMYRPFLLLALAFPLLVAGFALWRHARKVGRC
ncbi:MAG TPA: hypothetical protein VF278_11910 [Pirellulales bacterium]